MPAIITDTFDYDDIVRVLDLDEAFVHHQIDALQPKFFMNICHNRGYFFLNFLCLVLDFS